MSAPIILGTPRPDMVCCYCGKILPQIVFRELDGSTCYTPTFEICHCPAAEADLVAAEEEASRKAERERCVAMAQLKASSGIPMRYREKCFDNFHVTPLNRKLYTTATAYAQRFDSIKDGMGLYITGGCGLGKTHMATAIAYALIERSHKVICKTSIDLLADIRRSYSSSAEQSEFELLGDYLRVELLIIDDLGKESVTDWSLTTLYTLINMRYANMKPMVVTTNYTDKQLISRLGRKGDEVTAEAIVSRLHEACHTLEVSGEDYRKRKG